VIRGLLSFTFVTYRLSRAITVELVPMDWRVPAGLPAETFDILVRRAC
jgi:hypothetical protein